MPGMKKVLLFGASGNIGRALAASLDSKGYDVTAVVRNEDKGVALLPITDKYIVADVTRPETIKGICEGYDVVVSSLGKSVSPNERSKPSFMDVDFEANYSILREALSSGVKKFVYISVFAAEKYSHLQYFQAHFLFEQELIASGIDYTIVRPPAVFSSFIDLMNMAKRGRLVNIGSGEKRTNPIYEGDLGNIVVENISESRAIIEAGGTEVFTRREINSVIQAVVRPGKKIRSIPTGIIKGMLPVIKLLDRNSYDKFAFFLAVMEEDTIAPAAGHTRLVDYVRSKLVQLT